MIKIKLCKITYLDENKFFKKWINDLNDELIVFKNKDKIYIKSAVCPHFGGPIDFDKKNKMAILSLGSCDDAIREARDVMSKDGQELNYLRVRGFPFSDEVEEFIDAHEMVFIIEQNRDGQLAKLIQTETSCDNTKLRSLRLYNGIPIFSKDVVAKIMKEISSGKAA